MNENIIDYEKINKDFLDTLPLRKPEKGEDVRDYRYWMEEEFADVEIPEELHGDLLDAFNDYDLGLYLEKRFKMACCEEIKIYMM